MHFRSNRLLNLVLMSYTCVITCGGGMHMSGWPSGLRRCVQVAVSPGGVGSNPTSDSIYASRDLHRRNDEQPSMSSPWANQQSRGVVKRGMKSLQSTLVGCLACLVRQAPQSGPLVCYYWCRSKPIHKPETFARPTFELDTIFSIRTFNSYTKRSTLK